MWNPRSRILVIVHNFSDVHGWIESLWSETRAVDVLVMVLSNVPQFYVWFPYDGEDCRNVVKIVNLRETDTLFPSKINPPLTNCSLFAVASPLPPIVVDKFDGMEVRLFHDFAQNLGMNAAYVDLPANTYVWTFVNESGSPVNGLKLLREYQVDLMFGQIAIEAVLEFSDVLVPHFIDEFVWFVPGPKPAPRATAIYRGFQIEVWIGVIVAFLALFIANLLNSEEIDLTASVLLTLSLTINLSHKLFLSRTFKFLAIIAYIYSLHITTAYQSSLIIQLSDSPREKEIKNSKDLSETDLNVEFHIGHKPIVEDLAETDPDIAKIKTENRIRYTDYLDLSVVENSPERALLGPKIAFGFSLLEDKYYDEFGHPSVLMLPTPVFTSYMAYHVALGHPLQPFLKSCLQHLIEAGMPEHYIKEISKMKRPRLRNLQPFDIENVIGPFQLYLMMTTLCLISWIVEWIFYGWSLFRYRKIPAAYP